MSPADARSQDPANRPLQPRAGLATQRPATMPATAVVLSPTRPAAAPPPALPAAPPAVVPTPARLVRAVRGRLVLALYWGLAAGWLAAGATWFLPGLSGAGAYALVRVAVPESDQQTPAAVVREPAVLEAALADAGVAAACPGRDTADRVRRLRERLTADLTPGAGVLRIGLHSDRPEEAAGIVAAVARAYLDASSRLEDQERSARLESLTAAAARYEEQLRVKREALLQRTGGADDGNAAALRQRVAAEQLAQAEHDLFRVRAQVAALLDEGNARSKGAADAGSVSERAVEERLEALLQKDALYQKELSRQAALQDAIEQIAKVAAHPEVQAQPLRRERESSRSAAEARKQQLRDVALRAEQDQARREHQAATARREAQLAALRGQEKQLADRVKQLAEDARPRPPADDEVGKLEAEVHGAEDLAKRAGDQVQTLRLEQEAPPRAAVLEGPVVVPPDRRRQAEAAGLAGLGGFALALFGVGWWQLRAGRVDAPEEVTQWLGLRLLGAVPAVPPRVCRQLGDPGGGRDGAGHARLNEALDVTRTLLLRDPQADALQVILVTSAVGGEGKTTLASQLAASLARGGHKTLLVDADLRRPSAHRLFDLPAEPGLGELVRGEAAVADTIQPTRVSRLWFIAAGACDGHTPQALAQEGLEPIFEELRGQFDYVVLDACPVLPVADALLLARHADGVILSVLRDASRLPWLHAACQRLAMVGVRVLGAVVSGARGGACVAEYHDRMQAAR